MCEHHNENTPVRVPRITLDPPCSMYAVVADDEFPDSEGNPRVFVDSTLMLESLGLLFEAFKQADEQGIQYSAAQEVGLTILQFIGFLDTVNGAAALNGVETPADILGFQ